MRAIASVGVEDTADEKEENEKEDEDEDVEVQEVVEEEE